MGAAELIPPTFKGATASGAFTSTPTSSDPYTYQVGFGNRFATEALPGTLPIGCNTPQRCKYDLVSEQLNGTPFVSPRTSLLNTWFYRINPSVAHRPLQKLAQQNPDLESVFSPLNPNTTFTPQDLSWDKFPLPPNDQKVDFISGLKTIGGHGDPTLKEGLAVHIYLANTSMTKTAFVNNDGDMLILPQEGRLDIQTEFGHLMVSPGELVVIQAGMRFTVSLPDSVARGYIQEIYGSHYELPELGPVGSNGMAQPRDFHIPLASFDVSPQDTPEEWTITTKLTGTLYTYTQPHTPYDVVAWHGNYTPYKYPLSRFIPSATVDRDQSDPSIYCVLTAKSKTPGVALSDFLVFGPKWAVTRDTFRPPYYHRNMATEIMGMIYGTWPGSGTVLEEGGLTVEPSYMAHGESYQRWREATGAELGNVRVGEGSLYFMFHVSGLVGLTGWALERSGCLQEVNGEMWEGWRGGFYEHLGGLEFGGGLGGGDEMEVVKS